MIPHLQLNGLEVIFGLWKGVGSVCGKKGKRKKFLLVEAEEKEKLQLADQGPHSQSSPFSTSHRINEKSSMFILSIDLSLSFIPLRFSL